MTQGGCYSPTLGTIARQVVRWCLSNSKTLSAVHVAGEDNSLADRLSHPGQSRSQNRMKSMEWTLFQRIADQIFLHWGTHVVDLFATASNRKLPVFGSRCFDFISHDSRGKWLVMCLAHICYSPFLESVRSVLITQEIAYLLTLLLHIGSASSTTLSADTPGISPLGDVCHSLPP